MIIGWKEKLSGQCPSIERQGFVFTQSWSALSPTPPRLANYASISSESPSPLWRAPGNGRTYMAAGSSLSR